MVLIIWLKYQRFWRLFYVSFCGNQFLSKPSLKLFVQTVTFSWKQPFLTAKILMDQIFPALSLQNIFDFGVIISMTGDCKNS